MSSSENSNQSDQTGNKVTGNMAGRDITEINQSGIIFNLSLPDLLNNTKLKDFLLAYTGRDEEYLQNFSNLTEIQSIERHLLLLESLNISRLPITIDEIRKEYDNIILGTKMDSHDDKLKYKVLDAATCVNRLEFFKAHQLLSDALELITPAHSQYGFVYKEYLITGFIWYSIQNDVNGLNNLLLKKSELDNESPLDIDYIISMIVQEISGRDTNLKNLEDVSSRLHEIYIRADNAIKPAMANSLGLAYRRLGERTGIPYLEKAVSIFKEGLELTKDDNKIEVELKDQMAAAHIRIFEFNKDADQLDTAEKLLKECLKLSEGLKNPLDYRLRPRILNNLGNIYKQRILNFSEIGSAAKAITQYEKAEQYWSEKDANYDWALLKKNIAETKYALGKLTSNKKILLEALEDGMRSTKYRNLKNSPYQWGKTVKLVFSIVILLDELKSIKSIPKSTLRKILTYIKAVIEDDINWSQNISPEFVQNARQAQSLLL